MRKPSFASAVLNIAAGALALTATAADLSYTPDGNPPYSWSNTAAWGVALPGADDVATLADAGLLVHPLILETSVNATVSSCVVDNGILVVESGGSLTATTKQDSKTQPPHNGFSIAKTAGATGVITNYGTISAVSLDFGDYKGGKGALARFDNFGTLNIGTHFRMGVSGTPSVFYNHEGATFNKTGGAGYSFYTATAAGGDTTIINEGTMVCGASTETWAGNAGSTKSEIILRKSGTFDPGGTYKIGHVATTVTINLHDKSRLSGATKYNIGGANKSKGYITLSNESAFVTTKDVNLGFMTNTLGVISLADDATATFGGTCSIGAGWAATGIVAFADSSMGSFNNCSIGRGGSKSFGSLTLSDNASATFNGQCDVGKSSGGSGVISLAEDASATFNGQCNIGASSGGSGVISLADDATATFVGSSNIGSAATATGTVAFADSSMGTFGNCYIGLGGLKSFGSLTFSDDSSATFNGQCGVGSSIGGVGEMHLKNSALVTTRNQLYVTVNAAGCSTGLVTLADSSIISNTAGALVIGCYSNSFGRMEMRDNSRLVNFSTFYLGHGNENSSSGAHGELALYDNASVEAIGYYLYLGSKTGATGVLDMHGASSLTVSNYIAIGREQYATGLVTVADNASIDAGFIHVASSWRSRGALTVTNNAAVTCTNMIVCASNTTDGDLYISGGTVVSSNMTVAAKGTSDGCVVVADGGRLFCSSNITMAADDRAVADMTVTNGGFVQCQDLQLGTGTKGLAHLKVADDAVLTASNITLAVHTTASTGILEIAEGAIVSNDYIKIGCNSASARGILKMSGGSLIQTGTNRDAIWLNQLRTGVSAWIRGWGKVAFADPQQQLVDWNTIPGRTRPNGLVHYGQVIADGDGVERDLDFSRYGAIAYRNTVANPSGTNGWFAVNKGRLKLPRSLPRKNDNYRCSGDCYDLNYANETSSDVTSNRLANTFTTVFQGAALNNFIFSELYAPDRSDIPAGLDALGADRTISVWRAGLFTDGPEIDEPVNPSTFTSAKIHFRLPNDCFDDLTLLCVYRHDGTVGGKWRLVGHARARKGWPVVPARVESPSSANWNMGWFAVVGREKPFGTALHLK